MKSFIATLTMVLAVTFTNTAQVDRGEVELCKMTDIFVNEYDSMDIELSMNGVIGTFEWKTIWHGGMVEYTEVIENVLDATTKTNTITFSIVESSETDSATTYTVVGNKGTFDMVFWNDGSMVRYEFADGYTLIKEQ